MRGAGNSMAHRWMRAAAIVLALGPAGGPVQAQPRSAPYQGEGFGEPDDLDRRGGYDPRADDERFVRRDGWRGQGGLGSSICVTARGNCVVEPAPANARCGCTIPGFGHKRGAIAE